MYGYIRHGDHMDQFVVDSQPTHTMRDCLVMYITSCDNAPLDTTYSCFLPGSHWLHV